MPINPLIDNYRSLTIVLFSFFKFYVLSYLARSAKVAERAICFTDRNFYLFFSFF